MRPGVRREVDHFGEIAAHLVDGQRSQTIIAAKFEDHHPGVVQGKRPRQARQAAGGGFAGDAGIDDLVTVPFVLELCPQHPHPSLLDVRESVSGTDAVAEHENRGRVGVGLETRKTENQQDEKPFHRRSRCKIKSFSKLKMYPRRYPVPKVR